MGTLAIDGAIHQAELLSIETLVNEFYHPGTSNSRKHAIEGQLQQFQRSSHSWAMCLHNLAHFNNQYFWFFNVSTIEVTINQRWHTLNELQRNQINESLWSTYAGFSQDIPGLQRDKIAQLIALIGKRQFPEQHPDYMNQVMELLKNKFILGITLLRSTSDEITSTKSDMNSERQKYLSYCVSMYLPSVFDILEKYAELCITRTSCKNGISLAHLPPPFGDDSRLQQAVLDLLLCVQQIFSWAPLDNITGPEFFQSLFVLARWNESYNDVSISALTTISELFYRQKPLPLPTVIATGVIDLLQQPTLKLSNELYQDKLTELLRLFTVQQWHKWSKDPHFPAISYLNSLFQYTFFGYGALAFTERLTIWTPIIRSFGATGNNGVTEKHTEKLLALSAGTVKRMLFQYDFDQQLDMLDSEELDDDNETELQHFFNQCIDTIALIAEIEPIRVYDMVFSEFASDSNGPYAQVLSTVGVLLNGSCFISPRSLEDDGGAGLRCKFRDFISLCQVIARISSLLHECSEKVSASLGRLIEDLVKLVEMVSDASGDPLEYFFVHLSPIASDLVDVVGQTLITVRSLLLVTHIPFGDAEMMRFVGCIPRFLSPPQKVKKDQLKTLSSAAAQLLLSVSANLRPKYLVQLIKPLVHSDLRHMERSTASTVRRAICNCFVLPWAGCSVQEQNFEGRAALLQEYIAFIAGDLIRLDLGHAFNACSFSLDYGQEEKIVSVAATVLSTLRDLLDYYQEQSSSVKQMLAAAYRPVIEKTLAIYSAASSKNCALVEHIFDFCLGIIRTLQIQLGQMFLKNIILLFLGKTKTEQVTVQRFRSLDILLKMFLLIVEQPGNASLLSDIISFSIEHVLPLVYSSEFTTSSSKCEQRGHADASLSLYLLFNGILLHRWQYFYKSSVLKQFAPSSVGALQQPQSALEHSDQFGAIMNAYGQAIVCASDPHITRATLQSLQALHERWKLYQKGFFRDNLLQSFEAAIIKALAAPEGIMHYELLLSVLHSMGEVDMKLLHGTFTGIGFPEDSKLVEDVCLASDYPTFAHRMNQLIQDTKCGQLTETA
ncbi:exportin-6 isoform X2 [Toxorhynchites rutilus septentrionalis]|uniref:exportin-6 isoform X2 n=1 Tax=Toxorhynchites rutilus septentrionalis TaxID=329112 RepID=UPI00247920DB|nr:exportin-6 isoform X2 [Toxorhynchites rutilus septentrionalis]